MASIRYPGLPFGKHNRGMGSNAVLLAQRISRERGRRGWSKADLARKAGISPSYVTRIEKAQLEHPAIDKVQAIAEALRVDLSTLTDPPQPPAPDDDALLRKLIERRLGNRANTELVESILDSIRGQPTIDQQTVLSVVEVLVRSLPRPGES